MLKSAELLKYILRCTNAKICDVIYDVNLNAFFSALQNTALEVKQKFDSTTLSKFTLECINHVFEKTAMDREHVSKLMSHLIKENILPLQCFKNG